MSSTRGVVARCATLAMAAAAFALLTATTVAAVETTELEEVFKIPDLGPYEHCAFEGSTCSCNGEARFGYTGGDAGNGTNWVGTEHTVLFPMFLCKPTVSVPNGPTLHQGWCFSSALFFYDILFSILLLYCTVVYSKSL